MQGLPSDWIYKFHIEMQILTIVKIHRIYIFFILYIIVSIYGIYEFREADSIMPAFYPRQYGKD